jgi:hypothetical protein
MIGLSAAATDGALWRVCAMRAAGKLCVGVLVVLLVGGCAPVGQQMSVPRPPVAADAPAALAGPSTVGRTDGFRTDRRIRGRVTAVDPARGLVVINVGEAHGVRERDSFLVHRGEAYIGRIVVARVLPDYAAGRYGRSMRADVEVGDEAATRLAIDF